VAAPLPACEAASVKQRRQQELIRAPSTPSHRLPAQPQERADEKLQALLCLYANCPTPASQYVVLLVSIEFAKSSRALAQSLLPSLKGKAEEWVKAWKLPEQQARDLYLALAAFMKVRAWPGLAAGEAALPLPLCLALPVLTNGQGMPRWLLTIPTYNLIYIV
jgi:hypothetical protein